MKRLTKMIALMVSAVMLFGVAAFSVAAAQGGSCGENLTWTFEDGILTIRGEGEMTDYPGVSPTSLAPWVDLPVTGIVVEEGVTSLGKRAFVFSQSNIVSVSLPGTLTAIGDGALMGVDADAVSIAEGNDAFKLVDSCLVSSDGVLLLGCDESVIPTDGSVKRIGYGAFAGCNLTEITIPEGISSIGDKAFCDCKSLVSVKLPEGVKSIGSEAFAGCTKLADVTLSDGLTRIMFYAFSGCPSLQSVTLPASVKEIIPEAFDSNVKLNVYALSYAASFAEYYSYSYAMIGTLGDFDADGVVTVSDALTALRIAAQLGEADDAALAIGDIDGNGKIDVDDALVLLRAAAGLK